MKSYDVWVDVFGEEINVRVKAQSLDEAMRRIRKMTVLQFLEGRTLGQLDMVRGGSSVDRT